MAEDVGLGLIDLETGDTSQATSVVTDASTTLTADVSAALHETYGGLTTWDGVADTALFVKNFTEATSGSVFARQYMYFPSGFSWASDNNSYVIAIRDGSTPAIHLRLSFTGTSIAISRYTYADASGNHNVALTPTVLARDTLHFFEVMYLIDGSAGEVEVWHNGSSIGSTTGLNTNRAPDNCLFGFQSGVVPDNGDVHYMDDCKVDNAYIGAYPTPGGVVPTRFYDTLLQGAA